MLIYGRGVVMNGIRIVVTYNCNLACSNCKYKCGPYRKGIMDINSFRNGIIKLYERGYRDYVIIEGGEPFLHTGVIYKYLKKIKNVDTKKYIVTNGFWGDIGTYLYILNDLKEIGLFGIIIEYDYFHSSFIDISTVEKAIEKSLKNGLVVNIRASFLTKDISVKADVITFEYIKRIRESYKNIGFIFECINDMQSNFLKSRYNLKEKIIMYKELD